MSTFYKKRTLVVDGMNNFLRCVNAFDDVGHSGDSVGGVLGTLYTIGKAVRELGCNRVVIVYDGVNNTKQRRKMLPSYKGQRRMKREMDRLSDPEKEDNRKAQLRLLVQCFNYLPVLQLLYNGVEADDVIAYVSQQIAYTHDAQEVIIMSSDKDFLQLVNDQIKVWSPSKRRLYGPGEVMEEFHIHPENMIWYRAFVGDKSDEIKGVPGIGDKTVKQIPNIGETSITVENIREYANSRTEKKWQNFEEKFLENVDLMQLDSSIISGPTLLNINNRLHKFVPTSRIPDLFRLIGDNGIPLREGWISNFVSKISN